MAQANARKKIKDIKKVIPTFGSNKVCHIPLKSKSFAFFISPMFLLVSGKNKAVKTTAKVVTPPAIKKGRVAPKPMEKAAIAGPKTNPKLRADPMSPKAFARFSGLVESEITAKATGILPAVSPSSALERKRNKALGAKAIIKKDKAVPEMDKRSIGLRPYLSDKRPMMGVEINWHMEKRANSNPF